MPVHETKGGWKYGTTGKTYPDKKSAIKQALAIAYSKADAKGKDKPSQADVKQEISGEDSVKKTASVIYSVNGKPVIDFPLLVKTASAHAIEKIGIQKAASETSEQQKKNLASAGLKFHIKPIVGEDDAMSPNMHFGKMIENLRKNASAFPCTRGVIHKIAAANKK